MVETTRLSAAPGPGALRDALALRQVRQALADCGLLPDGTAAQAADTDTADMAQTDKAKTEEATA